MLKFLQIQPVHKKLFEAASPHTQQCSSGHMLGSKTFCVAYWEGGDLLGVSAKTVQRKRSNKHGIYYAGVGFFSWQYFCLFKKLQLLFDKTTCFI